jgi:hypothetical protein
MPRGPQRPKQDSNPSDLIYAAILKQATPIGDMQYAIDAELAVSALLGGVYAATDLDRPGAVRRFATDFARYLGGRRTAHARAIRTALDVLLPDDVTPPRSARTAGTRPSGSRPATTRSGGGKTPAWGPAAGHVTCTATWVASDIYGDQSAYVAVFGYEQPELGGPDHTVSYLLDHNLGTVKNLSIGVPASTVVEGWQEAAREDHEIIVNPVDPGHLRAEVSAYLARTDELETPPRDGYMEEYAFAVARLRLLPESASSPNGQKLTDAERDAVVADFLASPEAAAIGEAARTDAVDQVAQSDTIGEEPGTHRAPPTVVVAWCARAAVDFAVDENAGDPYRWSPTAVEFLLLHWAPRQLSGTHEAAPWLPEVLDALVAYAGRIREQSPAAIEATRDAITAAAVRYTDLMSGESLGEPVTDILARMVADGVDPLNEEEVLEWVLADRARRGRD